MASEQPQDAASEAKPKAKTSPKKESMWRTAAIVGGALTVACLAILIVAWWRNDWDLEAASMIGEAASPIIGILTLLTLGAALLAVRLQESESRRQQEVFLDQRRREQNAELRAVYAPFLDAVVQYHQAINDYATKMMLVNADADTRKRKEWQAPCEAAHARIDSLTQAIILVDPGDERGALRFKLQREVRLDPWHDNHQNQIDWVTHVLMWRVTERTEWFVQLRNSLFREFDVDQQPRPKREDKLASYNAEMKAKAEAIEKRTADELKAILKADYERKQKAEQDRKG